MDVYKKLTSWCEKYLYHFAFPPTVYEPSSSSTSSPAVGIVVVFILYFSHSNCDVAVSGWGFNLHFLNDWWYSCMVIFVFLYSDFFFFSSSFRLMWTLTTEHMSSSLNTFSDCQPERYILALCGLRVNSNLNGLVHFSFASELSGSIEGWWISGE